MTDKLTSAKIKQENQKNIKEMYEKGQDTEIMLRTVDLLSAGLDQKFSLGEMTVRLIDTGIKKTELAASICCVMQTYPTHKLSDIDKKVQAHCIQVNEEMASH